MKNADVYKYGYNGYDIGFYARSSFLFSNGSGFGKNVFIFGVHNSSSIYVDYKKDIIILVKGPTDE